MTFFFLKGLAFGFLLAATVGPMWVLCFRRTIALGPLAGFVAGMGIAVADGLYGAVAAFGLTAISGFLLRYSFWIALVGGVFLGSASWWILLAAGAGWLRGRIGPKLFRAINLVSGMSILGFAFWQLAAVLR